MKPIIIFIISCFTSLSIFAQNNITVSVILNGSFNQEIAIDGKSYLLSDFVNTTANVKNVITVTDLLPGQHKLQVIRTNNNNSRNAGNEKIFNLRAGYNLDIIVNGNGTMQLSEKRIRGRNSNNSTYREPMTTSNFNSLVLNIRKKNTNSSRISLINTIFSNAANYFTVAQVSQIIRLVTGDDNREELLEMSYALVTDPTNFPGLYSLISTQAGRDELAAYVNAYKINNSSSAGSSYPGNNNEMPAYNYNLLTTEIRNQYNADERVKAIYNAFSATANNFTADQARRLIQLSTGEANLLHLAKASYRSITDKNNFITISNLLPTQEDRNNLSEYVRTYNPNVLYTGTVAGTTTYRTPMSDQTFNALIADIRRQWQPGAKKTAAINAFTKADNYFTTFQAGQLIELDNNETNRLEMAKASYHTITDPNNFMQVYELFPTQSYRDNLVMYVRNFNANVPYNGTVITTPVTTNRSPISDADFNTMLTEIRAQWLPGAKKAAVINVFTTGNNYFTTSQAIRLIQLDNDEPDRLDMAKASYRTITDQNNFSQVYNLFTTQAYRDELIVYVRNNANSTNSGSAAANTGSAYRTPMADASFNALISNIRSQWLPGAKKAAVINAFITGNNYFTSSQARQLVELDNDEPDRLDMAKASFRTITDTDNFNLVIDIFTTQAYRDDLLAFIKANR